VDNPDPKLQDFLKHYREKFGKDPDAIGGLAYDAANVLFGAREARRRRPERRSRRWLAPRRARRERKAAQQKLRDHDRGHSGYAGVTGVITLDANRNASKPAVVLEIKGGKKVLHSQPDAEG
jgi:branched-chain amino acid transport system substrate-binding protein